MNLWRNKNEKENSSKNEIENINEKSLIEHRIGNVTCLKIMKAYNVVAFPTIFFISPEGKVLGKYPDLKMKVNPIRAIRKYFPFAKMDK